MLLPKGKTLYDILELNKDEVAKDTTLIKKAYRKLALQYHPDKQPISTSSSSKPEVDTTHQFQLLGYAYSILSDNSKRQHYDLNGGLDEHDLAFFASSKVAPNGQTWTNYFMDMMQGVVNEETLETHALKYKGSTEEEKDVLQTYTKQKGNMNHILAYVPHSKAADVPRFMDIINAALEAKKIESYPVYSKTTTKAAQYRRIKKEEKEAREMERRQKEDDTSKADKGKQRRQESTYAIPDDNVVVVEPPVETSSTEQDQNSDDVEPRVDISIIEQDPKIDEMEATLAAAVENATKQQKQPESDVEKTVIQENKVASSSKTDDSYNTGNMTLVTNTEIKSKDPLEQITKESSQKHDATNTDTNEQQPTRTIITRSMTRTRNLQKQTMSKNSKRSVKITTRKKTIVTTKRKMQQTNNKRQQQQLDNTEIDSNADVDESSTLQNPITKTKTQQMVNKRKRQQMDGTALDIETTSTGTSNPIKKTKNLTDRSKQPPWHLRPRKP